MLALCGENEHGIYAGARVSNGIGVIALYASTRRAPMSSISSLPAEAQVEAQSCRIDVRTVRRAARR